MTMPAAPPPEVNAEIIERAILARLTAKSDHAYQWPRWAAAEEAATAVVELLAATQHDQEQQIIESLERAAYAVDYSAYFPPETVTGPVLKRVVDLDDWIANRADGQEQS